MPTLCPICGQEHATLDELQAIELEGMKKEEAPKKKSKKGSITSEDISDEMS